MPWHLSVVGNSQRVSGRLKSQAREFVNAFTSWREGVA
jgi:hypothetical protein